jgi:hypothetical protein
MVAQFFQSGNGPVLQAIRKLSEVTGIEAPKPLVNWIPGVTPLSTIPEVTAAIALYFVAIFGIQELMR